MTTRRKSPFPKVMLATFLLLLCLALVLPLLSLPSVDGRYHLDGLGDRVDIRRDEHGVPSIHASSLEDAMFALGFTHAQDRLWQMEGMRRLGAGRLSEVVGEGAFGIDHMMRTLGLYRLAEGDVAVLGDHHRGLLYAYSAGVNAWIGDDRHSLPPEFRLLGFRPEPWQAADSIVWARIMATRLSGNWRTELLRLGLSDRLSPEQLSDLWPSSTTTDPVSLPDGSVGLARQAADLTGVLERTVHPTTASNAWVLGGGMTETGSPILANDPHLGFSAPVLWYLARIETPDVAAFGGTVPGVPAILLGRNRKLAWGMTTTHSDTQDLFIEEVRPDAPDSYRAAGEWREMSVREEVIRIKDADARTIRVRETRNGPVISDLTSVETNGRIIALRAAALEPEDGIAGAIMGFLEAESTDEALALLEDAGAPQQNIFLADSSGSTLMVAPGRVPVRRSGDGRAPVAGNDESKRWDGFIPFSNLPAIRGDRDGWIANANNRLVGDEYPYLLTADWPDGDRMRRLSAILQSTPPGTVSANAKLQMDDHSTLAGDLLPVLLKSVEGDDEPGRRALDLLRSWDSRMDRDRPEPLLFALWVRHLSSSIYGDETGEAYRSLGDPRPDFLRHVLLGDGTQWCDDVRSADTRETCAAMIRQSFRMALLSIDNEPENATWGDRHTVAFTHPVFKYVPLVAKLSTLTAATSGGYDTLNRGSYATDASGSFFPHVHGAGYRAVYDLSGTELASVAIGTGQSGNPVSGMYRNLFSRWLSDERLDYSTLPGSFAADPHQTLVLTAK